jgi:hypothetical protein
MGALEFEPDRSPPIKGDEKIDITNLWTRSRRVLAGKITSATDQIFRYGGTAGGARAKAIILFNPKKMDLFLFIGPNVSGFYICAKNVSGYGFECFNRRI